MFNNLVKAKVKTDWSAWTNDEWDIEPVQSAAEKSNKYEFLDDDNPFVPDEHDLKTIELFTK